MSGVIPRRILATAFVAAMLPGVSARPGSVEGAGPVERFAARATDMSGADAGRIGIVIERWSSDKEFENLRKAREQGPDKLLPVLQYLRHRIGFLQSPGVQGKGARARTRRAQNLQFAREVRTPTGRQVVIATDHHVGFGETARTGPAADYEFTLVDIRFGPNGEGVGKMGPATQVTYNKETNTIELENYDRQPVRLREVRSEKP